MYRSALFLALLAGCRLASSPNDDPLTAAVREGNTAEVRALVARGADPNKQYGQNSWPPLIHAVHKNQLGTAAALLDSGADINGTDAQETTALMWAAGYGNDDMVKLLLTRGADVRRANRKGETALDFALLGISDIDKFTLFDCQHSTVALLVRSHPELSGTASSSAKNFARLKRCKA